MDNEEQWIDDRLERLVGALEANTQVVAQLAEGERTITNALERLVNNQAGLADSQCSLTHIIERMEAHMTSTSAAVERLERIIDYLLRRDAEKGGKGIPNSSDDSNTN